MNQRGEGPNENEFWVFSNLKNEYFNITVRSEKVDKKMVSFV